MSDAKKNTIAILLVFILVPFFIVWATEIKTESPPLNKKEAIIITLDGVINPVAAEYVAKSIKKATEKKAELLIIQLDTPGGLDTSMRNIVKDINNSQIPIVVYVSPSGARAASAGVFITMAAHIAAMSPGTNIGAAHPVAIGEKMDKALAEKALNDAVAYIKSIAEQHGRNAKWAEDAVRKSISATEVEALKNNVIDLIANNIDDLLTKIHGKKVKVFYQERLIDTSNLTLVHDEMGLRSKILNFISDPNVAYLLMLIGFYGIFFELTNPGSIFPGVLGGICLVLAFYSFQTLPVNYAGLLLILIGIVLFILEVKVVSYGMLTIGGIVSVVLGSLMLYDSPFPFMKLSLSIIIPAAIITALFFIITFKLAYKAYKSKPVTGQEGLVGLEGVAKTDISSEGGMVFIHGEYWSAYADSFINKDEKVVVEEVKGLKLKVRKS
ncbi:MAG: nodulation protein NfeD [Thermodesulfovibrionales bacterium]|nr:nodulation protein NfeD [Thermodesulfovibrionales bacterium]